MVRYSKHRRHPPPSCFGLHASCIGSLENLLSIYGKSINLKRTVPKRSFHSSCAILRLGMAWLSPLSRPCFAWKCCRICSVVSCPRATAPVLRASFQHAALTGSYFWTLLECSFFQDIPSASASMLVVQTPTSSTFVSLCKYSLAGSWAHKACVAACREHQHVLSVQVTCHPCRPGVTGSWRQRHRARQAAMCSPGTAASKSPGSAVRTPRLQGEAPCSRSGIFWCRLALCPRPALAGTSSPAPQHRCRGELVRSSGSLQAISAHFPCFVIPYEIASGGHTPGLVMLNCRV